MDNRNFYGEALAELDKLPTDSDDPAIIATRLSAAASLAVYDAVLALRDEVEALPARLEKRLSS